MQKILSSPAISIRLGRALISTPDDDFGVEAFWIGDAARVGYFVPLNGPLNGHPPSSFYVHTSLS